VRLRSIPILVVVIASVAALGAWMDRPTVRWMQGPPVVHTHEPWTAYLEITRRGRGIQWYKPVIVLRGPKGTVQRVPATDLGNGHYRIRVRLKDGGFYSYTVLVHGDGIPARGTVFAIPR
jgi:hypothetical protein